MILVLFDESSIILAGNSGDFFFKLCVEELSVSTVIKNKGCNRPISDLTLPDYIFSTQCVYGFGFFFFLQKP